MADKYSDIDYELIARYLAGEASADEDSVVKHWLSSSEVNRQAFAQLKMLWEQTGKIISHQEADVDVDNAWNRFTARLDTNNDILKETGSKTRSLFYYISRVAAVLIIGAAFYLIYQNSMTPLSTEAHWATADNVKTDTLPDGSLISLNVHSSLSFPEEFPDGERPVALKGEAFFQVVPNALKPFVVKVEGASITVLGTSFYIQAYDSLGLIEVGVAEGSVKITTAGSEVILGSGETISIKEGVISPIEPYDPNNLYWKSRTLMFQNEDLETVFKTLEKHYRINITTGNERIADCRLTGKFYDEKIERIFDIINTNFNLTSKIEGNHIIVTGSGCN